MKNRPPEAREHDLLKIAAPDSDVLYSKIGHYLNLAQISEGTVR